MTIMEEFYEMENAYPRAGRRPRRRPSREARRRAYIRRRRQAMLRIGALFGFVCLVVMGILQLPFFAVQDGKEVVATTGVEANNEEGAVSQDSAEMYGGDERLQTIYSSSEYTLELRELASKNEEAIQFVYDYPQKKDQVFEIDLSEEAQDNEVPLLMQWDERWGYVEYSNGLVGYTGCGPTALSMVALYFLDNPLYSPNYFVDYSIRNEYSVDDSGSSWELIPAGAAEVGLVAEELSLTEENMMNVLDQGKLIILVVGPGDFTTTGHFMVVTGYDEAGFVINDPNSRAISEKTWDYETLSHQIRNLWSIEKSMELQ